MTKLKINDKVMLKSKEQLLKLWHKETEKTLKYFIEQFSGKVWRIVELPVGRGRTMTVEHNREREILWPEEVDKIS